MDIVEVEFHLGNSARRDTLRLGSYATTCQTITS
jgi:3-dehydroquinate dehydratase